MPERLDAVVGLGRNFFLAHHVAFKSCLWFHEALPIQVYIKGGMIVLQRIVETQPGNKNPRRRRARTGDFDNSESSLKR